ncbi:RNA polymerase sigma-70 factor [Agriterribacter sp.]|uniref:RNA polymerase sigma factor n=1 Tax=Agriterribacter sp. TaxID=2821509 RepID=UPI002CE00480|nr:RNA polymerase sigma-70 factor [Agriterribacter sp.]HRP55142.1 RNA polymerase sigma-70 factor [Agriterribacter sp.]
MPHALVNIAGLFNRMATDADESALWDLHKAYFHRLYRFVYAFTGIKETTEEIVNDVFLTLWQKRHLLHNVAKPEMYMFICAKNNALKQLKSQKKLTEPLHTLSDFDCVLSSTPHDIMITTELQRRINEAIRALPPKCKLIFSLVKENDLKYREVAELLGLSEKTIENQMGIALKKLSQSIQLSFSS